MLISDHLKSGIVPASFEAIGDGSKGDFMAANSGDGKVKSFVVDEFLNTFNTLDTYDVCCCALDTDKFLVIYGSYIAGVGYQGWGVVGDTTAGNSITWGTREAIPSIVGIAVNFTCCQIDTDKAFVTYIHAYQYYLRALVVEVSGKTISFGTYAYVNSVNTALGQDACLIDTDKVLLAFKASTSQLCVCTISGSTVTPGSVVTLDGFIATTSSLCKLNTDKAMWVLRDQLTTYKAYGSVVEVSGDVPTPATPVLFCNYYTWDVGICQLGTDKALVVTRVTGPSYLGVAYVINVSGTVPTFGPDRIFRIGASGITELRCIRIADDHAMITYSDSSVNTYGVAVILTVDGNEITFGAKDIIFTNVSNPLDIRACLVNTGKVVVAWEQDTSDIDVGMACTITFSGLEMTLGAFRFVGLAAEDFTDGNSVQVIRSGVVKGIVGNTVINTAYVLPQTEHLIHACLSHVGFSYDGFIVARDLSLTERMVTDNLVSTVGPTD